MAISHVWSGGLGNEQTVSLPTCQLRRIYELLSPLMQVSANESKGRWSRYLRGRSAKIERDAEQGTSHSTVSCMFWMDTLCLPKERVQRRLGISQMNRIYEGAHQVVILDRALQRMRDSTQEEEILANIVSSSWMSRCWTFQEGRLAQLLLVNIDHVLRDPLVIYSRAAYQVAKFNLGLGTWTDRLQLHREMAAALYGMRPLKDDSIHEKDFWDFVQVWNELTNRTTSRPEDEMTILALLLDLSSNEVRSVSERKLRLRAILRTQNYLPVSFLLNERKNGYGSNDENNWVPGNLTNTVDARYGIMSKIIDIGTGEYGFRLDVLAERSMFLKSASSSRASSSNLCPDDQDWQTYTTHLNLPANAMHRIPDDDPGGVADNNYLYYICRPDRHTTTLPGYHDRGCRLRMLKETAAEIIVAFDCSFSYIVIRTEEKMNAEDTSDGIPQQTEQIDQRKKLTLRCSTLNINVRL